MQSIEEHRAAKALAISEVVINAAQQVAEFCKIAFPKKRPHFFITETNTRRYRRIRKRKRISAFSNIAITNEITRMRILMILSQPRPKFPPGGKSAIVGEQGPELILDTKGNIILPQKLYIKNEETNKIFNPNNKSNESE